MTPSPNTSDLPLAGITVIDLSRALAGPYCTALLADLGASVIKVESGAGDPARNWPPFDGDHSLYFDSTNRNKQSIWIDLYSEAGRGLLDRLLTTADVLVDNFKLGTVEKMGYGADRLQELNPDLVHVGITAYGDRGPLAAQPGLDQVIQARAGMTSVTGPADGDGYRVGIPVVDIASGMTGAFTIVSLLLGRERGCGVRRGSTSLYETAVSMSVFQGQRAVSTGEAAHRQGNSHPSITPYGAYPTRTDHIVLAVSTEKHFQDFATLVGRTEWLDDPRFNTSRARTQHRDELDPLIEQALSTRSAEEWITAIQELGIPIGPIFDYAQVMNDDQTRALGLIQPADRKDGSSLSVIRGPVTLDGEPAHVRTAPPMLSEHADEVLTTLGICDEERQRLATAGTVRFPAPNEALRPSQSKKE
ncbi:Crotonobetainyl-CoA:carnitine CoA-transferase CaiB [Micrococcus luteus]|uniref:Crotonobetainyl-CoA:carnitine CoA-transferase CaiB n=1 Tax=Micrococcus luteus TaxID=1270 RepID=A0ABD7M6Y5_MICLU|nr:CoA transferase [Micrococcus luteus]SHL54721.1 Crotonobetainyl-CoA:carnitine CoA-transferase CaiB [Micrococcus luteus]